MRRVVVTGMGMVTPLACGVEPTWQRLLARESGARKVEAFDVSDMPCKIACSIPRGDGSNGTYNADQWMEPKEQRKVDEFIAFAMCAAQRSDMAVNSGRFFLRAGWSSSASSTGIYLPRPGLYAYCCFPLTRRPASSATPRWLRPCP